MDDLHRDPAPEYLIVGAVHLSHAAVAQELDKLVPSGQ
jgi:hypothetical protein